MSDLRLAALYQLTLAKVRDLWREPEALFWILVFPLLLSVALSIAFRARPPEVLQVAVQEGERAEWLSGHLDADPGLDAEVLDAGTARNRLRSGRVALVVLPGEPWTFWYDPTRPESNLARLQVGDVLQRAAGRRDVVEVAAREMTEKGSRYIDFLIPGLLGMNLLGTGVWGVGFAIVGARSRNLLKRLIASPMRKSHYLLAQIGGRLVFLVPEVGVLLLFARFVLGVPIRGSLLVLLLITLIGAMTFSGLGLLIASRARTIEGISGLINVVMMPMWILSGIFFSTSRFPDAMQPLIKALPLTPLIDALRAVMIDGASLAAVAGDVTLTAGWAVATFAAALWLFRWS